jgi:hypothetical protein
MEDNHKQDVQQGGLAPLPKHGKSQTHLWAQKFSDTYIRDQDHLINDYQYIRFNRRKHGLPPNRGLKPVVKPMLTPLEEYLDG